MKLTQKNSELAYVAGLIDGEGCFYIGKSSYRGKHKERKTPTYSCGISVAMCESEGLVALQDLFGGEIKVRQRKNHPTWRSISSWYLTNDRAKLVAETLLPFLRVKKKQANLLIAYRRNYNSTTAGGPKGSKPVPKSEIKNREQFFLQMKKLNKRGEPLHVA